VANEAFDMIMEPAFLEHANNMANHLGQALEGLKDRHAGLVVEVRGRGLLRGLKLTVDPKPVQTAARAKKLLLGVAGDNCVRMAPPLILQREHISEAIATLDACLAEAKAAA
jgi:acetylornithine/N-succinyldiaminopimelate aminotransferase